ncbi:MAG: GDSL-type esterase/lipase family protein [Candidatus Moranbacteria bacterium]|nr:GDSL-type esterase/lipase family protein [Candidatus Moranbacteria bacterium]
MKQENKKSSKKKTNKNIRSEIAIGIVLMVAMALGSLILFQNKKMQTDFESREAEQQSLAAMGKTEIKIPKSVVFLGDSITEHEDWNKLFGVSFITNAGISGNTTDDVLLRLDQALVSKPQKLFLMIGINDLLRGKDVEHVLANYETILSRIRSQLPGTTIYVQSVLPINNGLSKIGTVEAKKIISLNDKLRLLADGNKIVFIDLYPSFCGADNKLYPKYANDGVHPIAAGYIVWKKLISQYLD